MWTYPSPTRAFAAIADHVALDRAPLSAKDLETKKEHAYVTGLPLAAFDPNFGFGFGARANVYWNGARDAPLFAYAPYDHACR